MRHALIPLLLASALALAPPAGAEPLPSMAQLQARLGPPRSFTVVEPHLSTAERPVRVSYRGWPAADLLTAQLGPGWEQGEREIEFRALDGFVSRIPVERFAKYPAYLVFARGDGAAFQVDNLAQHEKAVPLGPYYLIWDNVAAPELLAEGGALWPYQVAQIALRPSSRAALLPAALAPGFEAQAALVQKFCLSCHQINGYGGDKMPLNLAARAKLIDAGTWRTWLLTPQALKPGTSMPPLPDTLEQREQLAQQLHDYLRALPVLP